MTSDGTAGEPHQNTFLSVGKCLETTAESCHMAAANLNRYLDSIDRPYRDGVAEIVDLENQLGDLLANYAERGPANVLDTRVQYNLPLPEPEGASNASRAMKLLQDTNTAGIDNLRQQAGNTIPPDVAEELDTLWRDAENLGRRISMVHVTMRDI